MKNQKTMIVGTLANREKKGNPNYFIDNNLHPVWYLVDDNGKYVRDANGKKIAQYHIPEELACLSM